MNNKTKNCKFCDEEILIAAIKCKHCGEFLEQNETDKNVTSSQVYIETNSHFQKSGKEKIMVCLKCGIEIDDKSSFCPNCGEQLEATVRSAPQSENLAKGTRDEIEKSTLIYPKNPPISPHLALLGLLFAGTPQFVFGQICKGVIFLSVSFFLFIVGLWWLNIVIILLSIVDGYKVGIVLKSGKPVKKLSFFPKK